MVRVVGVEPTLLAERVFETLASTIPPHPHNSGVFSAEIFLSQRVKNSFA